MAQRSSSKQEPLGFCAPSAAPIASAGLWIAFAGGFLAFSPWLALPFAPAKEFLLSLGLAWTWASARRDAGSTADAPMALLLGSVLVSAWISIDRPQSLYGDSRQPFYGVLQVLLYAGAFRLGSSMDERLAESGRRALVGALAAMGCVAVLQFLEILPGGLASGRAISTTGNPAFFGACAATLLPVALSAAVSRRSAAAWLASAAGAAGLAASGSRGAAVAAAAGAACWLLVSGRLKPRLWIAAAALGLGAAAAVGGSRLGRGYGDAMRVELWRAAARAAIARPVFGSGPDTFMLSLRKFKSERYLVAAGENGKKSERSGRIEQSSAHNDLLQAAATLGAIGLAAYAWLAAALAFAAVRAAAGPDREAGAAAAGALAAAFLAAKTNPVPPEACVAAAWLAGYLARAAPRASVPARIAAFKIGSAALCAVFGAFAWSNLNAHAADALAKAGRHTEAIAKAEAAAALAPAFFPWELKLAESIVRAAEADPARREELARRALTVAETAAARHPGNPQSHELYGTAAFFASGFKDRDLLELALREMHQASSLDPHHPYPPRRRMEIAEALGDASELARARADYERTVGGAANASDVPRPPE
ncbi:MAG: O-antigen ligase family protein [Elusimicrobia bacterium]|nr:O-antigen ligase family protein [Elusimicrobiota bacterium]